MMKKMGQMHHVFNLLARRFLFCLFLLAFTSGFIPVLFAASDSADTGRPQKKILVILSYYEAKSRNFCIPFSRVMRESDYDCEITFLSLNCQADLKSPYSDVIFYDMLPRIAEGEYDAVLAVDDPAFAKIEKAVKEIPPNVPVFFSHLRKFDGIPPEHTNMTGNYLYLAPAAALDLARRLMPDRNNVVLLTNSSESGQFVEKKLRLAMAENKAVTLTVLRGEELTSAEAVSAINLMEGNSILIYYSWYDKEQDMPDIEANMLSLINIQSLIPVFQIINMDYSRYGVVGGVLAASREECGVRSARQILEVFDGKKAAEIPPVSMGTRTIVNYEMLDLYGIPENRVPKRAVLMGKDPSFWTTYLHEFLFIAASLLFFFLTAAVFFFLMLLARRKAFRSARIIQQLPLRYIVSDSSGRILLLSVPGVKSQHRHFRTTADLPSPMNTLVRESAKEVFATGKAVNMDYTYQGEKRSSRVEKLPYDLFGTEAVIWMSHDTTELQNALLSLETSSELTRSAAFRFWPETGRLEGSPMLQHLWPTENGIAHPLRGLVHPDDLKRVEEIMVDLKERKLREAAIEFRTFKDGETRYFRAKLSLDTAMPGDLQYFGVIQDITEITLSLAGQREVQDLWETLINSIPFIFFVKDLSQNGCYRQCNKSFLKFMGRSMEEVIGHDDFELFQIRSDAEWVRRQDALTISEPNRPAMEEVIHNAEGKERRFRTIRRISIGKHGEKLLLGAGLDITELSALIANEQTLNQCMSDMLASDDSDKSASAVLRSICSRLGASRAAVFTLSEEFDFVRCVYECRADNQPFSFLKREEIKINPDTNWFRTVLRGQIIFAPDTGDPETIKRFGPPFELVSRYGAKSVYTAPIMVKGALKAMFSVFYERETCTLLDRESNFFMSCARVVEMMMERDFARKQLLAALDQARAAEKAKSYFLASMSHEIRTPLNAVIGFSDLLKDAKLPPETQRDYLASISTAGASLLALINDVLDLSKLEAGQMVFHPVETNFNALAREVGTIFSQRCREKELTILYEIEAIPVLLVDKLRLRQILFNLIGNAIKFTDKGFITIRASFQSDFQGAGTLSFSVADTGIGISAKDQEKLFAPFVQASAMRGTSTANSGTGLGLAIVRRMLSRMDGTITLESSPGKGSNFIVRIHRIQYTNKSIESGEDASTVRLEIPDDVSLLLVDDVPMNLKVLGAITAKLGVPSFSAASGEEALTFLQNHRIPIVMTDLWMPDMNGVELAAEIKRRPEFGNISVVAVTADVDSGAAFDMKDFSHIITKPVSVEKLRDLIARLIQEREAKQ